MAAISIRRVFGDISNTENVQPGVTQAKQKNNLLQQDFNKETPSFLKVKQQYLV